MRIWKFARRLCLAVPALVALVAWVPAYAEGQAPSGPAGLSQNALTEVQVAEHAFSRGTPQPEWVEPVAIPAPDRKGAVVVRLADTQFHVDGQASVFVHRALQSNDAATLKKIGEFSISFVPAYQRLDLHSVAIWRAGERMDRTSAANVRFLQPASEITDSVYTSSVVAAILLEDVRAGDTVEYAYTVEGRNPVFGPKFFDSAAWDGEYPIDLRRVVLTAPAARPIAWKSIGDAGTRIPEPTATIAGGRRRLLFQQAAIDAVTPDPMTPNSYASVRWIQFSEYRDWSEVTTWAEGLFAGQPATSPEFLELAERLRKLPDPEAQAAEALAFTQREIRYFSLSFGEGSHRPSLPDMVLKRRFGDCKDKTWFMTTLLGALGIEAHPVLLGLQRKGRYDHLLPSPMVFDHAIVQIRIGTHEYFVDPTLFEQKGRIDRIGQMHEGTEVLVIAEGTKGPTVIPLSPPELDTAEQHDSVVLPGFDGDAQLTSTLSFNGSRAAGMRAILGHVDRKLIEKEFGASFERAYPGAVMSEPLQIDDDAERNRIVVTAHVRIPGLAHKSGDGWVIGFHPDVLTGVVNAQASVKRALPMMAPKFPYAAHYSYRLDLPEEVSAIHDPSTRELKNAWFRCSITRSFRGNRAEVGVDFEALAPEIGADKLGDYVAESRKLAEQVPFSVLVGPGDLRKKGLLGIGEKSLPDTLAARQREAIEKYAASIRSEKLGVADLAHVYCDRAAAYQSLGEAEQAMRDANKAVELAPNDPEMLSCRAEVHFGQGEFKRAADEASRAVRMGEGAATFFRQRGMARFYLRQYAEAADDFARAGNLETDAGVRMYHDVWAITAYQRAAMALPDDLASRATANPRGAWPLPALAMLADKLSPDDMLKIVNRKTGDELAMTQTEAWFYLGQHYLTLGDRKSAREAFEKVRALGIFPYIEYTAARFELQGLGEP